MINRLLNVLDSHIILYCIVTEIKASICLIIRWPDAQILSRPEKFVARIPREQIWSCRDGLAISPVNESDINQSCDRKETASGRELINDQIGRKWV